MIYLKNIFFNLMDDIIKKMNQFKKIEIVFENEDILALNKPAGILVHPVKKDSKEKTLIDWLILKYPKIKKVGEDSLRPGIVHRLDRETSGVIIIAKNNETFFYLKNLFKERRIKKCYLALVFGILKKKSGIIDEPIGVIKAGIKRVVKAKDMRNLKTAITEYIVEETFETGKEKFSLLRVFPKTGRTNQIRVHLNSLGHSIVGDKIYASKKLKFPFETKRMFLHSFYLEFSLKTGQALRLEADISKEFKNILDKLRDREEKIN
jgi:23S rRNA pseudouridine1911/1915/1917 synthase